MGRSRLVGSRLVGSVLAAALGIVALAGCVQQTPTPVQTHKASSPSATPSPTKTADPVFVAGGSAADNKAFFDFTNNNLFAANGGADGKTIIDNLVNAGFDKSAMQVTPDKTSINGTVDSILFAVKVGDMCLLGQHGGGGYSSAVEAALTDGKCLVGKTRAIDW